jgi:hypothetical protein
MPRKDKLKKILAFEERWDKEKFADFYLVLE